MTQVTVNGHTYSDDGSTPNDMQNGGHRTHLLPMISDLMVEINAILGGTFTISTEHVRPLSGDTIHPATGLGAMILEPAGTIAVLNLVLPPGPAEGQIFEISTSATITSLLVTAPGNTVRGNNHMLTAAGGMAWRYHLADLTWYRRY